MSTPPFEKPLALLTERELKGLAEQSLEWRFEYQRFLAEELRFRKQLGATKNLAFTATAALVISIFGGLFGLAAR